MTLKLVVDNEKREIPDAFNGLSKKKIWTPWEKIPNGDGTFGKKPVHRKNDPDDFVDLETAIRQQIRRGYDGIGIFFISRYVGAFDLDSCRNAETGDIKPWAIWILRKARKAGSYIELSPSGTGFHIVGLASGDKISRKFKVFNTKIGRKFNVKDDLKKGKPQAIEIYRKSVDFLTITGDEIGHCTRLGNIDKLIDRIHGLCLPKPEISSPQLSPTRVRGSKRKLPDQLLLLIATPFSKGERSEGFYRAVKWCQSYGYSAGDIVGLMRQYPGGVAAKYLSRLDAEVQRCYNKPGGEPKGRFESLSQETIDEPDAAIESVNKEFACVLVGGKFAIIRKSTDIDGVKKIEFMTVESFSRWLGTQFLDQTKKLPLWKYWLTHKKRRQFEGVVFAPNEKVPGYFNMWLKFAVEPKKGDWSKFRHHLLVNVCRRDKELYRCRRDKELYRWVIAWWAQMFQQPEVKIGTSLGLIGEVGTGKTIVGEIFGSLPHKSHYAPIGDQNQLTGRFNALHRALILLQIEEAFWAGDRPAAEKLKHMITSPHSIIEHKGIDPIQVRNYVRLFFTGNNEWQVPASMDERRMATLRMGTEHKKDIEYFKAILRQINNGGREALLYHLLYEVDISKVDLRQIPKTEALLQQKKLTLRAEEKWLFHTLNCGVLPGVIRYLASGNRLCKKEAVFDNYLEHCQKQNIHSQRSELTQLGILLHKMLGTSIRRHKRQGTYEFGSLIECREHFERKFEQKIDWDGPDEWVDTRLGTH
jgi:hypothetical protein